MRNLRVHCTLKGDPKLASSNCVATGMIFKVAQPVTLNSYQS